MNTISRVLAIFLVSVSAEITNTLMMQQMNVPRGHYT